MSHKCAICGATDEGPHFIGFHAFGRYEVCDGCAEEHGCSCGCFPYPMDKKIMDLMQEYLGVEGFWQKDDNGNWHFIRDGVTQ